MNSLPTNTHDLQQVYDRAFYAAQIEGSARSASAVVPHILTLFPWVGSVVDFGCGTGTWLNQFRLHGVQRVLGLDGGNPSEDFLHIGKYEFLRRDLSMPFRLDDRFDLAMSLEVAEHLPSESARNFVSNITQLSDVVVFGAAIPGQGGTNHVNERWPSYWAALFREQGFTCFDILRGSIWYDERIEWWYRQNTLVFIKESRADITANFRAECGAGKLPLDLVHPCCFEAYRTPQEIVSAAQIGEASPGRINTGQAGDPLIATSQLVALRVRLKSIEQSTSWRAITILQRLVTPHPNLRRFIRGTAKLTWRALSMRPLERFRGKRRATVKRF